MIICFGEVLIDCLPEKNVIGGAPFNVAIHLKRLGHDAAFVSRIGTDDFGDLIHDLLKREELTQNVIVDDAYRSGFVSVDFVDGEPKYTIQENCAWQYIPYQKIDQPVNYVIFGSLATYFPNNKDTFLAYKTAHPDASFICDLNLRAPFYDQEHVLFCLEHTTILKINEDEEAYLFELLDVNDTETLVDHLAKKYAITKVLITKGEEGVHVFWAGNQCSVAAQKVPADQFKDTIGAGDSFTARFIHGLITAPTELNDNTQKAVDFAAQICRNEGAIPPTRELYK